MTVKGGRADLQMWQQVKDGCRCGEHPHFTHRTQPCLWTNKRHLILYINLGPRLCAPNVWAPCFMTGTLLKKLLYFVYRLS